LAGLLLIAAMKLPVFPVASAGQLMAGEMLAAFSAGGIWLVRRQVRLGRAEHLSVLAAIVSLMVPDK